MQVKVRTHPVEIYYVTKQDAEDVRHNADSEGNNPCFCTPSFGADGLTWETCEEFEKDYQNTFGKFDEPK